MINQVDLFGNTALNVSIERGNSEAVLFLLNNGADMTLKNKNHLAAIHQVIFKY
jgi:ankyrin repeat protein